MALYGGVTIPGHPDLENVRKLDLLAIPMIRRCHRYGIMIDKPYLAEVGAQFAAEALEVEKDIISYIPVDRLSEFQAAADAIEDGIDEETGDSTFNPASSEQICKLIFDILGVGKSKDLKRTKKGEISTGKKQLELLKLDHPVIPRVLRHRELTKLNSTYCSKLPRHARFHPRGQCCPVCELAHDQDMWRVHGTMGTTRAETGRINHKNPNLGNIPTRTKDGRLVLGGFVAPQGKRLLNRDLSQIELRDLAHLSQCPGMIDVFLRDGDMHNDTCHNALNVPLDQKPAKELRTAAKRVNVGIQNGTTGSGLYMQIYMDLSSNGYPIPDWLTVEWCDWFIVKWLESRPEVQLFFEKNWYRAKRYRLSWDLFGRTRLIPETASCHSWIRQAGLRQAQNLPVTATAAGHLKLAMGKVEEYLLRMLDSGNWCWPLLTIHDAIMAEADEDCADDVLELMGIGMDTCMNDMETGELLFSMPIKSDGEVMQRWEKH